MTTPIEQAGHGSHPASETEGTHPRRGPFGVIEEQLGLRQLIREYLIPVETNTLWYTLGGVLGIALVLEFVTGMLITLKYLPDAEKAYSYTYSLMHSSGWRVVLGFHYFNSFLIFGLVMVHMMRVFVSGGYRRGKQGLWLVGAMLAGLTLIAMVTGETLHWDEVGFAVPWHVSEVLQAVHLSEWAQYRFSDLKDVDTATSKLIQIYALHVAIIPVLLILTMVVHYYLVRVKGISLPFWHKASGKTSPFSHHIRAWLIYSGVLLGAVLLLAIFVDRGEGTKPQLLPDSPLYGSEHGPGGNGYKPSYPISWTHGMNVFFAEKFNVDPDIWGSIVGTILMTVALVAIPFVDAGRREPADVKEGLNWRKRGFAFIAIAVFWAVMVIGIIQNEFAGAG